MTASLELTADDFTAVLRPARDALPGPPDPARHGVGEAADGWVRAVVAPDGRVVAVQLGEAATALTAEALTAAVVSAVNDARAQTTAWQPGPLVERQRDSVRAAIALVGKLIGVVEQMRQD